jgi:hypothetical protein
VFCCTVDHVEVAVVPACLDSLLIGLYVVADEFFIDARARSPTPSCPTKRLVFGVYAAVPSVRRAARRLSR